MKIYSFGNVNAPIIMLLPGTCCHWKANFEKVIQPLSDTYRVLCESLYGYVWRCKTIYNETEL